MKSITTEQKLSFELRKLNGGLTWLVRQTKDIRRPHDERELLCVCMSQHCQSIAWTIRCLLEQKVSGVARTLARPLFESYVRSVWVRECASQEKIEEVITKNDKVTFPRITGAIKEIEESKSAHTAFIKRIEPKLTILNDWVHIGLQICTRQFDGLNIQPNYPIAHEFDFLDSFVRPIVYYNGLTMLSALGIEDETDPTTFANELGQELAEEY